MVKAQIHSWTKEEILDNNQRLTPKVYVKLKKWEIQSTTQSMARIGTASTQAIARRTTMNNHR